MDVDVVRLAMYILIAQTKDVVKKHGVDGDRAVALSPIQLPQYSVGHLSGVHVHVIRQPLRYLHRPQHRCELGLHVGSVVSPDLLLAQW